MPLRMSPSDSDLYFFMSVEAWTLAKLKVGDLRHTMAQETTASTVDKMVRLMHIINV